MISRTRRTGAIASVTVLFALLCGTAITGATAQDQTESVMVDTGENTEVTALETAEEAQPRFVSQPVVQEVADPALAADALPVDAASLRELVGSMPQGTELSRELRCLAQAVYFESRGEPLSGQLAVARVVINRAESSLFPDDYCSVVTQRAQFSFVRGGRIPEPNARSSAWHRAHAIARIAHQEMWDSEATDSLYFHATYVRPRWARSKVARARINSHVFYR